MIDENYINQELGFELHHRSNIIGSQNRHVHSMTEILFILSGNRSMFIESESYSMKTGDIVIIPPNTIHKSFNNLEGSEIYYIYTKLEPHFLTEINQLSIRTFHDDNFIHKLEEIRYELISENSLYEYMIRSLIDELIINYIRANRGITNKNISVKPTRNKIIQDIITFLNTHLLEDLRLSTISDLFGLSEEHLSRLFPQETGFNFIEYVNSLRVKEAQRLIILNHNSLNSIAENSGFGSYNQFGRVFKSLTGLTPREFRKNQKNMV